MELRDIRCLLIFCRFLQWLETKLTELGMLTHPGYKFTFVLDKTSMFHTILCFYPLVALHALATVQKSGNSSLLGICHDKACQLTLHDKLR